MASPTFATCFPFTIDDYWVRASMLPNAWFSLACARDLRGLYKTEWCLPRLPVLNPDNLLTRRYCGKASAKAICQRRGQGGLRGSFFGSQTSSWTTSYPPRGRDTLDGQEESPDSRCGNVRVRGVLFGV